MVVVMVLASVKGAMKTGLVSMVKPKRQGRPNDHADLPTHKTSESRNGM